MASASIPVNLFNPGQVFACLGFLEAADVLLGRAGGGFDWAQKEEPQFVLHADGEENPIAVTLEFLAEAQLQRLAPLGYTDPPRAKQANPKRRSIETDMKTAQVEANDWAAEDGPLCRVEDFPAPRADWLSLPVRLSRDGIHIDLTHWSDGSSRQSFKLFAGQQRSAAIARLMLNATRELWIERRDDLIRDPFELIAPLGGSSFKFDARKAWTTIGAGFSPDEQGYAVEASPVVELLAAVGLEHARPHEFETREVCYGAWKGLLPPMLARPVLGGVPAGVPCRLFRFSLDLAGKNKVATFAREEITL